MDDFRSAIIEAGLTPPPYIEPGRLHRFPGIGNGNGNTAGWCRLFDDQQGGVFGDWSTDLNETWQSGKPLNQQEMAAHRRQVKETRRQAYGTREDTRQQAAI